MLCDITAVGAIQSGWKTIGPRLCIEFQTDLILTHTHEAPITWPSATSPESCAAKRSHTYWIDSPCKCLCLCCQAVKQRDPPYSFLAPPHLSELPLAACQVHQSCGALLPVVCSRSRSRSQWHYQVFQQGPSSIFFGGCDLLQLEPSIPVPEYLKRLVHSQKWRRCHTEW